VRLAWFDTNVDLEPAIALGALTPDVGQERAVVIEQVSKPGAFVWLHGRFSTNS
jgi:hypothetical protein